MRDAFLTVEISFRQVDAAERNSRLDQLYNILLEGAIAWAKKGCQGQENAILHGKISD